MSTVSTNIKIDAELKKQAQVLFEELGMNLSTAVNIFLKQSVREHAIPFRIGDPFYSSENMRHLSRVISEIESGEANLVEHDIIGD